MDQDVKDFVAASAKGTTQAVLKPAFDLWDNLVLPYLAHRKERVSDELALGRLQNLHRLKKKWDEFVNSAGINPVIPPPKMFLPLLEYASVEDDDDLHTRWAALLANASNQDHPAEVRVAFVEILRQITSRDALFLDRMYDHAYDHGKEWYGVHEMSANSIQGVELQIDTVASIYDHLPHDEAVKTAFIVHGDYGKYPNLADHLSTKEVMLRNLMRLGLLDRILKLGKVDTSTYNANTIPQETLIFITALGYEFVRACRAPEKQDSSQS